MWSHGKPGTRRHRKYWMHVWRRPRACPGGDCICDFHEGKTDRLKSRSVQKKKDQRLVNEYRNDL